MRRPVRAITLAWCGELTRYSAVTEAMIYLERRRLAHDIQNIFRNKFRPRNFDIEDK